jgi:hypothetical protein
MKNISLSSYSSLGEFKLTSGEKTIFRNLTKSKIHKLSVYENAIAMGDL